MFQDFLNTKKICHTKKVVIKITSKNQKNIVITGAGVSIKSGLPSGPELCLKVIKSIANGLGFKDSDLERLAKEIPLEKTFQILSDYGLGKTIAHLISNIDSDNPSPTHLALAKLANSGKINFQF